MGIRLEEIKVFIENEIKDKGAEVAAENITQAIADLIDHLGSDPDARVVLYAGLELRAFGGM